MADIQQLVRALQQADAAGDDQAAQIFAKAIRIENLKQSNPAEYDPGSPEFQKKYGAAGVSNAENFQAGAGKAVIDLGRGIGQLGAQAGNKLGLVSDESVAGLQGNIDAATERDRALLDTGAGLAGNIAGNIATIALPGTAAARGAQAMNLGRAAGVTRAIVNPATFKAGAASGSLYGALQPVESGGSRLANTALGAATGVGGQGLAKGLSKIAQPIQNVGSAAIQRLKDVGVPLDLAQRTGSTLLQRLKLGLNANPLTAAGQRVSAEAQQKGFTAAVLKTIGIDDADAAVPEVMQTAKLKIGQTYDDLFERNPVKFDDELEGGLFKLLDKASDELDASQFARVERQVERVLDKADTGAITGRAWQNLKTSFDRLGKDKDIGFFVRGIRDELKDALGRQASEADRSLLQQANTRFQNLKAIEDAISKDGTGMISPARLTNSLSKTANRWRTLYGGGDQELVNLAQSARSVLPETLPDSGTAGRLMAGGLLTGGAGIGASLSPENADKFALTAALLYGGPKAVQSVLNRAPLKARYLSEGIRNPTVRKLLETPNRTALTKQAMLAAMLTENAASK